MKPSVGRTVHYVSYGTPGGEYKSECRAAIVTSVKRLAIDVTAPSPENNENEYDISLCVLNPEGMFFKHFVPYDEWNGNERLEGAMPQGGSWHWPEREE